MNFRRYPVKRTVYIQSIGRLLPHRISQIFEELGFETWINPKQGNDMDLKVFLGQKLIIVAEILNWSIGSKLSQKRKNCIIKNLSKYHCEKLLIYTILDKDSLEYFTNNGISLIEIGYQILPKTFYQFFSEINRTEFRKADSKETYTSIKRKIIDYLFTHPPKINTYKLFCSALFQPHFILALLPWDRRNLVEKAKRALSEALTQSMPLIPTIKTRFGELDALSAYIKYPRRVVKSIFDCLKITTAYAYEYLIDKPLLKTCLPNKLYHGTTTAFLPQIEKEGLYPSEAGKCWKFYTKEVTEKVCLTPSMYIAEYYAIHASQKYGGEPVVLEINVEGLKNKSQIRLEGFRPQCQINVNFEVYFTDAIPPGRIKNWYIVPKISAFHLLYLYREKVLSWIL
jgi:hypothetical protein